MATTGKNKTIMKIISFRITLTVIALIVASLLTIAFSFLGDKTKGPISDFFSATGAWINNTENKLILQTRKNKRSDKLTWLKSYKSNIKLLKNPSIVLLGAYDNQISESFEGIINLEDSLQNTLPLIHIYAAWGSKIEQKFPKTQVEAINALGSIAVITWEPWLTDFSADEFPNLRKVEQRDKGGLKDVANGVYDKYIIAWAKEAAKINAPIFLRVGHEMNDPYRYPWGPQNNEPKDFIAAFKHVHDLFLKCSAINIIWVWSPHPAYGLFKEFYPGNDYVDYVGTSALNYGSVASWSKWWSFDELVGKSYNDLCEFKKPLILTEFGCLAVGGKRSMWFKDALNSLPNKYSNIKSVVFFHYSEDKTVTQQTLNWYIIKEKETMAAIKNEIKKWPKKY